MLEPQHYRINQRPNVYPYNAREETSPKNRTTFHKTLIKPEQKYVPGGASVTGEHVPKYQHGSHEVARVVIKNRDFKRKEKLFSCDKPLSPFAVSKKYNSASWRTENQIRYKVIDFSQVSPNKKPFLVTTIDSKRHTPQSKHIFHIHRVNQKPICTVQSWPDDPKDMDGNDKGTSIYMTSFKEKPFPEVTKYTNRNTDRKAEGIVPFNLPAENFDVRSEMMLPVCETTRIPSAPHPHKYLLRRRKVPPQFKSFGIFYNNKGEAIQSQSVDCPLSRHPPMNDNSAHVSITSLCGQEFTRRRYIAPPPGILTVTNFDGGAKAISSNRFDEKYLPFIRAKSVI